MLKKNYIFTIKKFNQDNTYDIENEFFTIKNVPEKYLGEKL